MYRDFGLYIDGRWRAVAERDEGLVFSPVTEKPLGHAPVATLADAKEAIASAARGLALWKSKSAFERADALHAIANEMVRRQDEAARMISTETGKPRRAVAELKVGMVGINSFALAASEAPFGGTRYSGMGREGGSEGIEGYLDTKLAQVVF